MEEKNKIQLIEEYALEKKAENIIDNSRKGRSSISIIFYGYFAFEQPFVERTLQSKEWR